MADYGSLMVPVYANTKPLESEVKRAAETSGTAAGATISGHLERGISRLKPVAGAVARSVATGIGLATTAAVAFGVEAYKAAAKVQAYQASLDAMAKANHVSTASVEEAIGSLNRFGITTEDAQKTVGDLIRGHINLANATKLGKIAQDEAAATGKSYTVIETALTKSIATGNTGALARAGIYIDSTAATKKWADAHGVLVKNMTLAQKQQATLDAVLQAGGRVAGAYAAQLSTPAGALKFMKVQAEELTIAIGERLLKATRPVFLAFSHLAGAIFGAVAPGGKLVPVMNALQVVVGKLAAPLAHAINALANWITKLDPAKVKTFADMFVRLGPAIAAVAGGAALFTGGEFLKELPFVGSTLGKLLGPFDQLKDLFLKLPLPLKLVVGAFALLMAVSPQFRKEVMSLVSLLVQGLAPILHALVKAAIQLVPVIVGLAKAMGPVLATALQTLTPLLDLVVGALKALAPILPFVVDAILAIYAAVKLWSIAQAALDIVLDANPIGLVVIALGALVLILIEVWKHCKTFRDIVLGVFRDVWGFIKRYWPLLLGILTGPIGLATEFIIKHWKQIQMVTYTLWVWFRAFITNIVHDVQRTILSWAQNIRNIFNNVIGAVTGIVRNGFNAIKGWVSRGASDMVNSLKNMAGGFLSAGRSAISNLLGGIAAAMRGIGSWVKRTIVDPIVGAVKSFFGIHSPSKVMEGLGESITQGFVGGIVKQNPLTIAKKVFGGIPQALGHLVSKGLVSVAHLPGKALDALRSLGGALLGLLTKIPGLSGLFGGGGGGGTGRWGSLMMAVLKHFGIPQDYGVFMAQMMTESGGNPNAINNWDSNAKAGIPSQGLMQVIPPTFAAYAGPYRSRGILDPLANIYAAVAYAISRYGSSIPMVLGHGHGYATGGILNEPVAGIGLHSGERYSFGENAPRVPEMWSPLRGPATAHTAARMQPIVVNVFPRANQSEVEIAAAVSRRLDWAVATGRA